MVGMYGDVDLTNLFSVVILIRAYVTRDNERNQKRKRRNSDSA